MANTGPTASRVATAAPSIRTHLDEVATPERTSGRLGGLGQLLDARLAFGQAQGMLADITGCSLAAAGKVLLQVGAQLGLDSADGVAEFFLVAAATAPGGPEAQAFIRQARNKARSARDNNGEHQLPEFPKRNLPGCRLFAAARERHAGFRHRE